MMRACSWCSFAAAALFVAFAACGDDDDGGNDNNSTSTGGSSAEGGGGATSNGGSAGDGGTAGSGGAGVGGDGSGGAIATPCDNLCAMAAMSGCRDPQCLEGCQALSDAANAKGCTAELQAYFDCMVSLPDICNPLDCSDETNTVYQCSQS